jgi:hypothetical protein
MYLALKSVEAYRAGVQKKALRESERDLANFNLHVIPGSKSNWLKPEEKESHFEVMVAPRFLPKEEVVLHGPRALGRFGLYAVRKTDFKVTRDEFDKY